MSKIKIMIMLFTILKQSRQQCLAGCLKCTDDNRCQVCDSLNKYFLNGTQCEVNNIEFCQIIDISKKCLLCEYGKYLQTTTNKCIDIEENKVKQNCKQYDSSMNCLQCDRDYWIDSGNCSPVQLLIKNCNLYQTDKLCQQCDQDYLKQLDGKKCLQKGAAANCQVYSPIKCQTCNTNYILNKNLYFLNQFKYQTTSEISDLLQIIRNTKDGSIQMKTYNTCQQIELLNCVEFLSNNQCNKCQDNHYLKDDKTCQPFPKEQIENCKNYSSSTNCQECNQGYYLKNNRCEIVSPINQCAKYDPQDSVSRCIECNVDYILSGSTCTLRQQSLGSNIKNCSVKNLTEDKCAECSINYIISTDGLMCFTALSNCKEHTQVSSTSTTFSCKTCADGYFINDKVCDSGSMNNCKVFSSSNTCIECQNMYFLSNTQNCQKHNEITNCEIYDGINENAFHTCLTCTNNSFDFVIEKQCNTVQLVKNCIEYNRNSVTEDCLRCQPGFYLASQNTCSNFADTNCYEGTAKNCTHCNAGFALDKSEATHKCLAPHDYVTQNCITHDALVFNDKEIKNTHCTECENWTYPWNVIEGFVCVKEIDYLKIEGITDQVPNCYKYSSFGTCLQCKQGYYTSISGQTVSCKQNCEIGESKQLTILVNDSAGIRVSNTNKCIVHQDTNCEFVGPLSFSFYTNHQGPLYGSQDNSLNNHICIKCKSDYFPVIGGFNIQHFSQANPNYSSFSNIILDPLFQTAQVSCLTPTNINNQGNTEFVQKCDYYQIKENQSTEFYCVKCDYGYYGKVKEQAQIGGYIESCIDFDKCDTNTQYHNAHPVYLASSSCFKCLDNLIPFIPLEIDLATYEIKNLKPYDLNNANFEEYAPGDENFSINCLSPNSPSNFGDSSKFQEFPDNCGLGVINLSSTNGNSSDSIIQKSAISSDFQLAIFCGSCKPGFQPTYMHQSTEHIVVRCVQIPNCGSINQTYFNACSECDNGYAFEYDSLNKTIKFDVCTKHSTENCFSALPFTDSKNGFCKICNKGFVKNEDHFCEEMTAAKCSTSTDSVIQKGFVINLELNYMIYSIPQGNGCNNCTLGYLPLEQVVDNMVCSISPYLQTKKGNFDKMSDQTTSSVYIENCMNYGLNDFQILICMLCNSSYILNENKSKCLNTVTDCQIASSTNDEQCYLCQTDYALINYKCVGGNISNCSEYEQQINNNTIKCKKCNKGYYSDSNKTQCKLGKVPNCLEYIENNLNKCKTCEENFVMIQSLVDVCYPIDEKLNCNTASIQTKTNIIQCLTCKEDNQILHQPNSNQGTTENQMICMKYNLIENCDLYDVGNSMEESTFLCKKCKQGYYLKDYECLKRTVEPASCQEYEIEDDKCSLCASGHYLDTSGKSCNFYPKGIIGCEMYISETTCQFCKANRYWVNNTCPEILPANQIDNCLYYSSENTCSQCNPGYVLDQALGICQQSIAQNCETYASVDACATCKQGFGLKDENGQQNCISVNKSNCLSFEQTGDFNCLICQQNYYPDDSGNCQQASPTIVGCLKQSTNDICETCKMDLILDSDKKSCLEDKQYIEQLDPNCLESILSPSIECSGCYPGNYFENNVCKSCQENQLINGCFQCDILDNKICLICNTGYYMDSSMNCLSENVVVTPPTTEGPISGSFITMIFVLHIGVY